MICTTCGEASQHAACPYCGTPDPRFVAQLVGYIPSPLDLGYWLAGKEPPPRMPDPLNPVEVGTEAAEHVPSDWFKTDENSLFGRITSPFAAIGEQIGSFATVIKWVIVGGAIVGAIVLLVGVFKYVPIMLGAAVKNVEQVTRVGQHVAEKALTAAI